jgi:hypothetical protein
MHRSGWVPSIVPDDDDQTICLVDDAPQPGRATQLQHATPDPGILDPKRYTGVAGNHHTASKNQPSTEFF